MELHLECRKHFLLDNLSLKLSCACMCSTTRLDKNTKNLQCQSVRKGTGGGTLLLELLLYVLLLRAESVELEGKCSDNYCG